MANVRYPGTAGTTPGTVTASDVTYNNTTSGLTADDVQEAIDEIDSNLDTLDGKVYKTDDSTETIIASDDKIPFYDVSATSRKNITVANIVSGAVSNPNLLDNPWFTVNQRGQSSYTHSTSVIYTVDRWEIVPNMIVDVDSNGISITNNSGASNNLFSFLETKGKEFVGKTLTLSVLCQDGTIRYGTKTLSSYPASGTFLEFFNDFAGKYFGIFWGGDYNVQVYLGVITNATENIRAMKLELGSISTLAMDTAPNYATELLKCQRYFQRIGTDDSHTLVIGSGHCYGTYLMFNTFLPVPMRANPTLTVNGGVSACRINVNGSGKVVTSFGGVNLTNNIISMTANTASDIGLNGYAGDVHIRAESGNTLSLNFSADL